MFFNKYSYDKKGEEASYTKKIGNPISIKNLSKQNLSVTSNQSMNEYMMNDSVIQHSKAKSKARIFDYSEVSVNDRTIKESCDIDDEEEYELYKSNNNDNANSGWGANFLTSNKNRKKQQLITLLNQPSGSSSRYNPTNMNVPMINFHKLDEDYYQLCPDRLKNIYKALIENINCYTIENVNIQNKIREVKVCCENIDLQLKINKILPNLIIALRNKKDQIFNQNKAKDSDIEPYTLANDLMKKQNIQQRERLENLKIKRNIYEDNKKDIEKYKAEQQSFQKVVIENERYVFFGGKNN